MEISVSFGDDLKKVMTLHMKDDGQSEEVSRLHQLLMKKMAMEGPRDKTGVPFTRPTIEPRVG